jgi:hypothetical protein
MSPRSARINTQLTLGLAAATFCGAWPLAAQEPVPGRGPVWALEGLSSGHCVRFLIDPAAVRKQLGPGLRLIRADQDPKLHPALRTVLGEQPEFAAWTPASLCLFYSDAIRLGGRRLGSKNPKRKQMLGVWAVGATEGGGARRDMVLDLFGSSGELVHVADQGRVKVHEASSAISKAPGTGNDLYDIRVGKTRLIWNGRAAGDTTAIEQPMQELWMTRGANGTFWKVTATMRPAWTRSLVGVLTVEGKDDLAKALKNSPTRFVGPLYLGGGGELRFSR